MKNEGHAVKVADYAGSVLDITARDTVLKTWDSVKGVLEDPAPTLLAEDLGNSTFTLAARFWMAQERAQKQNVAADCVLRHGDLRRQLIAAARESDVTWVVLGKPAGEESAFALAGLEALAAKIETEAKVETCIT